MKSLSGILSRGLGIGLFCLLSSCFSREEKKALPSALAPVATTSALSSQKLAKSKVEGQVERPLERPKDKSLMTFVKLFEQADAVHREAWWVLSSERRPQSKSPFGKIQRALLSSQNIKLTNKSMFACDRYVVKRDVLATSGFPQSFEIFEKCSEKLSAKKIAQFFAPKLSEIQARFFPENMEEILGLGATVLNKTIQCTLRSDDLGQLTALTCKDWAQDRSKEHMIRLDVYDYQKSGRNIIKLRGKVYENLTDTRKIEADVPMSGKIYVTETELYPPEVQAAPVTPPAPVKPAAPTAQGTPVAPVKPLPPPTTADITPLPLPGEDHSGGVPPPRGVPAPMEGLDPDVLMMQQNQQRQELPLLVPDPEPPPALTPEQIQELPPEQQQEVLLQQLQQEQQQQQQDGAEGESEPQENSDEQQAPSPPEIAEPVANPQQGGPRGR